MLETKKKTLQGTNAGSHQPPNWLRDLIFTSSHGQSHELVSFSCTETLIFLERHTRLFVEPAI